MGMFQIQLQHRLHMTQADRSVYSISHIEKAVSTRSSSSRHHQVQRVDVDFGNNDNNPTDFTHLITNSNGNGKVSLVCLGLFWRHGWLMDPMGERSKVLQDIREYWFSSASWIIIMGWLQQMTEQFVLNRRKVLWIYLCFQGSSRSWSARLNTMFGPVKSCAVLYRDVFTRCRTKVILLRKDRHKDNSLTNQKRERALMLMSSDHHLTWFSDQNKPRCILQSN